MYTDFLFDLYGTLVDIHTDEDKDDLWHYMAGFYAAHGADYTPSDLRRTFRALIHEQEQQLRRTRPDLSHPEIDISEVFARMYRDKGVILPEKEVIRTGEMFRRQSTAYVCLYPGARELLEALKKVGRVWLLSNAQVIFTVGEMKRLGIYDLFDGIYISSACGCKKPDASFYRKLLKEQQIEPSEAVMIGNDGICDIQGAKKVGLHTVYLKSNLSPQEPWPEADLVMERMDLQLLRRLLTEQDRLLMRET